MEDVVITLSYGDIIQIIAPKNTEIHEHIYWIDYILENQWVRCKDSVSLSTQEFRFESGAFSDQSIEEVHILYHEPGRYAEKNGLVPQKWVDVWIGIDIPFTITGQITQLVNDRIELTRWPNSEVYFFDFEYKGMPLSPSMRFTLRDAPKDAQTITEEKEQKQKQEQEDSSLDEDDTPDIEPREALKKEFLEGEQEVIFSDEYETIAQQVELQDHERLFPLEAQLTDMMSTWLSTIPSSKRSPVVMAVLHRLSERYKQLHSQTTFTNDHGKISILRQASKPLIPYLDGKMEQPLTHPLNWIVPVVTCRRQLHTLPDEILVGEEGDADIVPMSVFGVIESLQKQFSRNELSYQEMLRKVEAILTPYDTTRGDMEGVLKTPPHLPYASETIIDNQGNFLSSVVARNQKTKKPFYVAPFVQQTFVQGTSLPIDFVTKNVYRPLPITRNDTMNVKSFVSLPSPVIECSKLFLPTTSIQERQHWNEHYILMSFVLNQYHNNIDDVTHRTLLQGASSHFPKHYVFPSTKGGEKTLLEDLVPETHEWVSWLNETKEGVLPQGGGISLVTLTQQLEPFLIYHDRLTYRRSYKKLRRMIITYIDIYRKHLLKRKSEYTNRILSIAKITHAPTENKLVTDILRDVTSKTYETKKPVRSSELMNHILSIDGGGLLGMFIQQQNDYLKVDPKFVDSVLVDDSSLSDGGCAQRVIAKKYINKEALEADNNKTTLYHDPDLDDTPYHILDRFAKDNRPTALALSNILITDHACPPQRSMEMAETLLRKSRLVQEGEFAVIQDHRKQHTIYYRREGTQWEEEPLAKEEFFVPSNDMFCNIDTTCIKTSSLQLCDNIPQVRNRYLKAFRQRLEVEDQNRGEQMTQALSHAVKQCAQETLRRQMDAWKSNYVAYDLGQARSKQSVDDSVASPGEPFLNQILAKTNEAEKQKYLLDFVQIYTRPARVIPAALRDTIQTNDESKSTDKESVASESVDWLYCKTTNKKLLPTFVYQLAKVFQEGGADAFAKQQQALVQNNKRSEDDAMFVDKATGWEIGRRMLVEEIEFDEQGRVLSSSAVLEPETVPSEITHVPSSKLIMQVLNHLCPVLGVITQDVQDFVLRMAQELMLGIESKEQYTTIMTQQYKGKKIPPYQNFYDKLVITCVTSALLIRIQTAIPKLHRTHAKTCQSVAPTFHGYPLTDISDQSGIQYLACVLHSLKQTSTTSVWHSMEPAKHMAQLLLPKLKTLYVNPEVQGMYKNKRDQLAKKSTASKVQIPAIQTWPRFMPPLYPLSIVSAANRKVTGVTPEFHREFLRMMAHGHKDQDEARGVYQHKLDVQGFAIIELIHLMVRNEPALIMSSQIPNLQNACCNDIHPKFRLGILDQLAEKHPQLLAYRETTKKLSKVLTDTRYAEMAPLYCAKETIRWRPTTYPVAEMRGSILKAIIHYLDLDHPDQPLPPHFRSVITEKPKEYEPSWTDVQKIEFIEKQWRKPQLEEIMKLQHQSTMIHHHDNNTLDKMSWPLEDNIVPVDTSKQCLGEWQFKRFIKQEIERFPKEGNYEGLPLQTSYTTLVHHFDAYFEDDQEDTLNLLKVYLTQWLEDMTKNLHKAWTEYDTTMTASKKTKLFGAMDTMSKWNLWNVWNLDHDSLKIRQFIRDALQHIVVVYPEMVKNNVQMIPLPTRWNLAPRHYDDFTEAVQKKCFAPLSPFTSEDAKLLTGFAPIDSNTISCHDMMHFLDMFCPTMKRVDDTLTELLYRYAWIVTLHLQITPSTTDTHDLEQRGQRMVENRRRVQLIKAFIEIEENKKEMVDKTLHMLTKETNMTRAVEKKRFTDLFKNLDKEGRKLMKEMKQYGLGIWSEGKKGLVNYSADAYERERRADDTDYIEESDIVEPEAERNNENEMDAEMEEEGYDVNDGNEDE